MKQFTLLYIVSKDEIVQMKTFLDFRNLIEFRNDVLNTKNFKQVDDNGYVWFSDPRKDEKTNE